MTKGEFIHAVAAKAGGTVTKKMATAMVDTVFDVMGKAIKKSGKFTYPGFGTWTVRSRKARKGRNPQTGQQITIKASKTVGFKPSKDLKATL